MPAAAACSAILRWSDRPGEYLASAMSYAGNQQHKEDAERRPKCAATTRLSERSTDRVPAHPSAGASNSSHTRRSIQGTPNLSRWPVRRYCADFQRMRTPRACGSLASNSKDVAPASRSSFRSFEKVDLKIFFEVR